MSWADKKHPVERAIEWLAAMPLAAAVGWASLRLGLPGPIALVTGAVALGAGLMVMRMAGGAAAPMQAFAPAGFESVEPDELLLEEMDSVLELDDPLVGVEPDSRVVRLFAREEPTPGELVDRIVDFLAEGRRIAPDGSSPAEAMRPDASLALHEALANIRASLR